MNAVMWMLAVAASGVVAGRAELPEGGFEYVIQIEPHLLDAQPGGVLLSSDVPPGLRGARRFRVIVGEGPLPDGVTAVSDLPAEQLVLAPPKPSPPVAPSAKVNPAAVDEGTAQPTRFEAPDDAAPLAERTAGRDSAPPESAHAPQPTKDAPDEARGQQPEEPTDDSEPWAALLLTMLGLFVSLGGNVFLGWNFLGLRKRYRAMIGGRG